MRRVVSEPESLVDLRLAAVMEPAGREGVTPGRQSLLTIQAVQQQLKATASSSEVDVALAKLPRGAAGHSGVEAMYHAVHGLKV
jgi:hypothetical protein